MLEASAYPSSSLWSNVIERDGGRVQLSVLGKGHKRREVLLPEVVSRSLLSRCEGTRAPMTRSLLRPAAAISLSAPSITC